MSKQSLMPNLSQQLQLTPKLQQAIRMLQLSTEELTQFLQDLIASNIMVDLEPGEEEREIELSEVAAPEEEEETLECFSDSELEIFLDRDHSETFLKPQNSAQDQDITALIDRYQSSHTSLRSHLLWQLNFLSLSLEEKEIAEILIDAIDDRGFLLLSLEALQQDFLNQGKEIKFSVIQKILSQIQSLGPTGVGARSVQESLLLQLEEFSEDTMGLKLAQKIIEQHFSLLVSHQDSKILQACRITQVELAQAIELIHHLHPYPGNAIGDQNLSYVIPDVLVKKEGQEWLITLNEAHMPKLRLNQQYATLMSTCHDAASYKFVQSQLEEARWALKSLEKRNETLLKVSMAIMQYQQDFLNNGPGAMLPLTLQKISETLEMHPSTISRITTQKYIQTPKGTFELKYFFTAALKTNYGEILSAKAIQTFIQEMVKLENPAHPLSDEEISQKLLTQGIRVARRTVTKYRETLSILTASQRKSQH